MKKETKKIYRAKLDDSKSKIVGWPKFKHQEEKRNFWQAVRALLF